MNRSIDHFNKTRFFHMSNNLLHFFLYESNIHILKKEYKDIVVSLCLRGGQLLCTILVSIRSTRYSCLGLQIMGIFSAHFLFHSYNGNVSGQNVCHFGSCRDLGMHNMWPLQIIMSFSLIISKYNVKRLVCCQNEEKLI